MSDVGIWLLEKDPLNPKLADFFYSFVISLVFPKEHMQTFAQGHAKGCENLGVWNFRLIKKTFEGSEILPHSINASYAYMRQNL